MAKETRSQGEHRSTDPINDAQSLRRRHTPRMSAATGMASKTPQTAG